MANTWGHSKGFGLKIGPKMGLFRALPGPSWEALLEGLFGDSPCQAPLKPSEPAPGGAQKGPIWALLGPLFEALLEGFKGAWHVISPI